MFDVLGFYEDYIYFRRKDLNDVIRIKKNLPKEDLILHLKIKPEECKAVKDAILIEASKKPLHRSDKNELYEKE